MSKTKKLFKIKFLALATTFSLVLGTFAPSLPGKPTYVPGPQPALAQEPVKSKPLQPHPVAEPEVDLPEPDIKKSPTPQNTIVKGEPIIKNGRINYPYYALKAANDPLSSGVWNHNNTATPAAWDITTGLARPVIAVIDTGYGLNHEDLANRWWVNSRENGATASEGVAPNCTSRGLALNKNCDNIDNDSNGYIDDWRGWDFENADNDVQAGSTNPTHSSVSHGTQVAGIIGATGNNSKGLAGINWGATIMPLQALSDDGTGYTDAVASAVTYAADNGATVINLSLGSTYQDSVLQSAINYAVSKNVVVIAASGNDGCECVLYPANYSLVIAVGAATSTDTRAGFSSYGANLDVMAPGTGGVCTTVWSSGNSLNGYTCSIQGTSFASPHVAGAVSLLLAQRPGLTPAQVEMHIRNSANRVAAMSGAYFTTQYGYGRLNVARLLGAATIPVSVGQSTAPIAKTASMAAPEQIAVLCQSSGPTCILEFNQGDKIIRVSAATVSSWRDTAVAEDLSVIGLSPGAWEMRTVELTTERSIDPQIELTLTL